jgi:hypothetical protein
VEDRRAVLHGVGHGQRLRPHGRPVLDRGTHVAEHAEEVPAQLVQHSGVGLPVDLEVDERLSRRHRRSIVSVEDVDEPPVVVAHREDGAHGEMQAEAAPEDLRRHRVDDEGHVVGHDVDDGVRRAEPVLLEIGRVHPHRGYTGRPVQGEGQVRHRDAVQVVHAPGREVVAGDVPVVLPDERPEQPLLLRGQPLLGVPPDLVDALGLVAGRDGGQGNPLVAMPQLALSGGARQGERSPLASANVPGSRDAHHGRWVVEHVGGRGHHQVHVAAMGLPLAVSVGRSAAEPAGW